MGLKFAPQPRYLPMAAVHLICLVPRVTSRGYYGKWAGRFPSHIPIDARPTLNWQVTTPAVVSSGAGV
jgi:hypothetical protein